MPCCAWRCSFPSPKRLDDLLRDFGATLKPPAIVIGEFGRVAGLITIEDVLEEIVGEIEDEFDDERRGDILRWPMALAHQRRHAIARLNEEFGLQLSDADIGHRGGPDCPQWAARAPAWVPLPAGWRFRCCTDTLAGVVRWFQRPANPARLQRGEASLPPSFRNQYALACWLPLLCAAPAWRAGRGPGTAWG